MELSGKQRRYLRSLGHHMKPALTLGRAGLSDAVMRQIDATLGDLELVKLRFGRGFEDDRKAALTRIVDVTGAALAGSVGRTALIYRAREEDPGIRLPRDDER